MLKRWIIASAALCLLSSPVSAHDSMECANTKSTAAQLQCLKKIYEKQKIALNDTFAENMKHLETDGRAAMKQAQTAWVTYRDLECPLEAQSVENASLERLKELQCLTKLTRERIHVLSEIKEIEPDSALGVLPRWMNVLGSENPKIHWNYAGRIEQDIDCDSENEYAMTGIEHNADGLNAVVALAESVTSGKPKTTLFRFPFQNADAEPAPDNICQTGISLSVLQEEANKEGEETRCGTFVKITDGQCYESHIRMEATGFVRGNNHLAVPPEENSKGEPEEKAATPEPPPIPGKKKK